MTTPTTSGTAGTTSASTRLPLDARLLAVGFTASGTLHLVRPRTFKPLVPAWLPRHRDVIWASGVAELLCAAGLAHPRTRRAAAWASAAVLVGVFPGNLEMARRALAGDDRRLQAVALARLPLQAPMVRAALRAARTGR